MEYGVPIKDNGEVSSLVLGSLDGSLEGSLEGSLGGSNRSGMAVAA